MNAVSAVQMRTRSVDAEVLAYGGLTLAAVGWAAAYVAGKVVLAQMTPLAVAAWRFAVAALVLLPFAIRSRPGREAWPAAGCSSAGEAPPRPYESNAHVGKPRD